MKKLISFLFILALYFVMAACGDTETPEQTEQDQGTENNNAEENLVEEDDDTTQEEENAGGQDAPFSMDDFVVEIEPNGKIDSAGGVEYSYTIKNNSEIPVQEFFGSVKFEFEDGQTMIEDIDMFSTIMAGESVDESGATIYPEPASLIKSYKLIGYEVLDENGTYYEVDLQLETIDAYDYGAENVVEDLEFDIGDFDVVITPTGEIDSAGGVVYSYEVQNNSPIPVKEISMDVRLTFENGMSLVENISVYETLMNGDTVGESHETVYPEPPSKIKSYKLIGYQILDKNDVTYDVDTQLNVVNTY